MEKTITVINPLGLHARPAAKVVDCAARFTSDIRISYQSQEIDAKKHHVRTHAGCTLWCGAQPGDHG